jgi:EmrB/QacA subfamily drug resistance transporter
MQLAYKWRATLVAIIGVFMAVLDLTIVNVALPVMQTAFHTDRSTITWVVTGYFLAQAAVIPITGYLADRFGSKIVYLTALALFTVGSAMCAFAPNEGLLIAFRVVQGVGGGALLPLVFALSFRLFPPEERGPASAIIGVPILLAPAFGPTIGGYLTTTFDWNSIFKVNVPIGVVGFVLALLTLRGRQAELQAGDEPPASKSFDVLGLVLSMAGFTSLVYGINTAGETTAAGTARGFGDHTVLAYTAIGIVLLIAFVVVELRVSDPVMDIRLFSNYTFAITNVISWSVGAFLFGALFLLPIFFENVQGHTALDTGIILIWQGLSSAVGVAIAGRLYNVFGPRPLIIAGMIAVTIGTFGITNLQIGTDPKGIQVWLILRGLGLGMANIPLQTLTLSRISNYAMARASSLVNVTRQVFSAVGITILTSYLLQQAVNHSAAASQTFQTTQLPAVQAACAQAHGQNASAIQACIQQAAKGYVSQHALVAGLNDTFLVVTIACAAVIGIAIFVGRDPAVKRAQEAARRGEKVELRPSALAGE